MPPLNQAFAKAYRSELPGHTAAAGSVAVAPAAPPRDVRSVTNRAAILPLSAATEAAPAPRGFQALLQIERCLWPETVLRLAEEHAALGALDDELQSRFAQRHALVGVTATCVGAGCTTLVQTLARRFGRRGAKVAVVDAHFAQPQLAGGWQILPQLGWEHMLRGELALDEVLIESTSDHLTILPLKGAAADAASLVGGSRFELGLRMLRQHFPLTLLDLGTTEAPPSAGLAALLAAELLDGVVLVHDARRPDTPALRQAHELLVEGGVGWTAVAENFVAHDTQ